MKKNEQDARQAIIDAAKALLDEIGDPEKITIRKIAAKADVGIGLVNYHFKSKDNLLSIAIGDVMIRFIENFSKTHNDSHSKASKRLKKMIKGLCDIVGSNETLTRYMVSREIMDGNMQTPLYLIPLLREIAGNKKSDLQLRLAAMQIIHPIQASALNPDAFRMYSGINLFDIEQRNQFVDTLIDNILI